VFSVLSTRLVLRREDWAAWLDLARPEAELLRALPTSSLKAQMGQGAS
jgi:putative SOS response-associated peptidase YedK